MKEIELQLIQPITDAVKELFTADIPSNQINFQTTRKEFDGDVTLVVFPMVRLAKKSPEQTANDLGDYLVEHVDFVENYNFVKGFLNMVISESFWLNAYAKAFQTKDYGRVSTGNDSPLTVVEYCSPNTNKPLHLGHIRNNLLGFSVAQILKASGRHVKKVQCIKVLGGAKRKYASVGDVIVVSVKDAIPRGRVKKGDVRRAVIVRTAKEIKRSDGSLSLIHI